MPVTSPRPHLLPERLPVLLWRAAHWTAAFPLPHTPTLRDLCLHAPGWLHLELSGADLSQVNLIPVSALNCPLTGCLMRQAAALGYDLTRLVRADLPLDWQGRAPAVLRLRLHATPTSAHIRMQA
jgi:hypothetical protein